MASLHGGTDYRRFKAEIELYLKQTEEFTPGGVRDTSAPMDVGGIGGKGQPKRGK